VDSVAFDGVAGRDLARQLGVPQVNLFGVVPTTMDLAHAAAEAGAPAGTLIIAEEQAAGRGRGGKRWQSPPRRGLWMTLIERPRSGRGLDVLSLRLGLCAAEVLDPFAAGAVRLKWPNDLQVAGRKLAGILVEARWRDQHVEWVAIGFGLNVAAPDDLELATGLVEGTRRIDVLSALVPALRQAAAAEGTFTDQELARYAARDVGAGRRIRQPAQGVVVGVSASGELLVDTVAGRVACHGGSLVFAEEG